MQASPPGPLAPQAMQHQQPTSPVQRDQSRPEQNQQQEQEQPSLPPSQPVTPPAKSGPLVRRLSGNAFRDNKPPPPLLAAAQGIPKTPEGSGVKFVLNEMAAHAVRSVPANLGQSNDRVFKDPRDIAYTRLAGGRAIPLNALQQHQQQLHVSSSPTRATPGVFKQFKSPLVSPQPSMEAVAERRAKEEEKRKEEEKEEERRALAQQKEEEDRQLREALKDAEREEEENAQSQNQEQRREHPPAEHRGAPQQHTHQSRQQPPQPVRQPQQQPMHHGDRLHHARQQIQQAPLVPSPQRALVRRKQQQGGHPHPQQVQQQHHRQAQSYYPEEHEQGSQPRMPDPRQRDGVQRSPYAHAAPARYSPYGPHDDVFIDRNAPPPATQHKRQRERGEDQYDMYEQDHDAKRPRSRSREQSPLPAQPHEGHDGRQDEQVYPSPEAERPAQQEQPEEEEEEEDEEEEIPFDPTAPIEPYDHVKEIQEPWNHMMEEMLPYIDEWAEKYLTISLDTIVSTYVCFYNKAKKDAQSLEEGFETIKSQQQWQNSRRQTFIHFRKQMENVAAALVDLDPEHEQAWSTPTPTSSRTKKAP